MTALVFALETHQVCIAMDTLVVEACDKKPLRFQRKFMAIPRADLVVAGTGLAYLVGEWFSFVSKLNTFADIDDLNQITTNALNALAEAMGQFGPITTTLYHFGYSGLEKQYVGYAYRSTSDFRPEKLLYGLGIKPQIPITLPEDIRFPELLVEIMLEQQRQDHRLPLNEQVGIGGDIEYVVMKNNATNIQIIRRFATYETEMQFIDCRKNAN